MVDYICNYPHMQLPCSILQKLYFIQRKYILNTKYPNIVGKCGNLKTVTKVKLLKILVGETQWHTSQSGMYQCVILNVSCRLKYCLKLAISFCFSDHSYQSYWNINISYGGGKCMIFSFSMRGFVLWIVSCSWQLVKSYKTNSNRKSGKYVIEQ